jgi:hypothetical protein
LPADRPARLPPAIRESAVQAGPSVNSLLNLYGGQCALNENFSRVRYYAAKSRPLFVSGDPEGPASEVGQAASINGKAASNFQ